MELRTWRLDELRVIRDDNRGNRIQGYAAVFDQWSNDVGGFRERIRPGAFTNVMAQSPDTRALQNHDANLVLGRTISGTLRMGIDTRGLEIEITPPDTTYANDLLIVMERGDVDQMSFAFNTENDEWTMEGDQLQRDLIEIRALGDVSVVTYPAYPQTSAVIRSLSARQTELRQVDRLPEAALIQNIIVGLQDDEKNRSQRPVSAEEWRGQIARMRRRLQMTLNQ